MFRPDIVWHYNSVAELSSRLRLPAARKLLAIVALALFAMAASSAPVRGGFDVFMGDLVTLSNGPGSPGGIFYVDVFGRGTTNDFPTYCVELYERISLGPAFYVQNVGLQTSGLNPSKNKTLGAQTAWLYTQFIKQDSSKLVNFGFPSPTTDKSNALQLGIWKGLISTPYSAADIKSLSGWSYDYIDNTLTPILQDWLDIFNYDVSRGRWSGTGNVMIMNLRAFAFSNTGNVTLPDGRKITLGSYAQDQLVMNTPELPALYSACTVVGCALMWGMVAVLRKRASAIGAA